MAEHPTAVAVSKNLTKMEWTEEKDVILCREVLYVEPYLAKERTAQRAQLWHTVAEHLNDYVIPKFKVDKRSVREHLTCLVEKYKRKMRAEEQASGISPEPSTLDNLLETIVEKLEDAANISAGEDEEAKKKAEKEKEQAQDMRLKAMESLAQTKKRNKEEDLPHQPKRSRSNGSETVAFLREKSQIEGKTKERELELLTKQVQGDSLRHQQMDQQHREMMQMLLQQQQQQQYQMQQFQMTLATQQQQQNQMLLAILKKNQ